MHGALVSISGSMDGSTILAQNKLEWYKEKIQAAPNYTHS